MNGQHKKAFKSKKKKTFKECSLWCSLSWKREGEDPTGSAPVTTCVTIETCTATRVGAGGIPTWRAPSPRCFPTKETDATWPITTCTPTQNWLLVWLISFLFSIIFYIYSYIYQIYNFFTWHNHSHPRTIPTQIFF